LFNRVVDHHVHLVLHDYHVHHNPYQHIHLQFVVDLDSPYENTVAYKDHIVAYKDHIVAVDNHPNAVYHHHRPHVLTIHLLDGLQ
jgi:hypothetical protein